MITWPQDLVDVIARRKSVIFIGSGVSRNSTNTDGRRPATWEGFLRAAAAGIQNNENILARIDVKDYLTACEIIKRKMGADAFSRAIQDEYQRPGYIAAKIHETIYALDSSIVASPNFDVIYDTYARRISEGTIIVKSHRDPDILNFISGGESRLLLKVHGTADNPNHVIFTRQEYAKARTDHRVFYEIIKALSLTHRFFFIGCGYDDPDIRLMFEDVFFAHSIMPEHYMTLPSNEVDGDISSILFESMKIRVITYSPEENHQELTDSLEDLVNQVDKRREDLTVNQKW
ncbi:SIR2 family protein [Pseudomonas aeruginosa]|uniref:SIR2 family protein n=1 Tax=Pseudomonas aeruginosa TaxID=287 RepID=UPI000940FC9D|nr:SIR2 family protein [Pseudomonas aeruginosa]ELK4905454.1 SIR2 family protein [Pseudomonas aeruginosa]MBG6610695.1 SIR2 family protein [Pseudomonas aeruginosa]RTX36650.1 SIR2 family protein [Pseudomonas aeruginosa]HCE6083092.1 SIR2 family protein [Pseudomonas aeruginosa]HEJ1301331.1 SIR2 family protein [Pseudomonas aeruginosa]